jgi:hypothetical protein
MKFVLVVLLALQVSAFKVGAPAGVADEQPHGAHGVRNEQFGLFLRPRDASNRDGEPIVLYPQQPWKCMAWHFDSVAGGTRLVNFLTGKSFEVQQASANKPLVQMPSSAENQQSEVFHFVLIEKGLYRIMSNAGDALTAIDSDRNGDIRVVSSPWKNSAAQRWQVVDLPDHFTM